jgi:hypothetical protein
MFDSGCLDSSRFDGLFFSGCATLHRRGAMRRSDSATKICRSCCRRSFAARADLMNRRRAQCWRARDCCFWCAAGPRSALHGAVWLWWRSAVTICLSSAIRSPLCIRSYAMGHPVRIGLIGLLAGRSRSAPVRWSAAVAGLGLYLVCVSYIVLMFVDHTPNIGSFPALSGPVLTPYEQVPGAGSWISYRAGQRPLSPVRTREAG